MADPSPESLRILTRYTRAWAILTVIAGLALGSALIIVGYVVVALPSKYADAFRAIGDSVIASLILYILISIFLDPRRQQTQARALAGYAIAEANRQFQLRFEVSLPTAVYEASSVPKPGFREHFVSLLQSSTRYDHCGTTARFASFRLSETAEHPEITRLDQVRLAIIDPRASEVIRAHCQLRLRRDVGERYSEAINAEILRLRGEIYTTLMALYDIRNAVPTVVYLHSNLPYFRCEMFDRGMFLTYYLGGASYPETLEFSATTRPYRAYKAAMLLVRRFGTKTIQFGHSGPSADLIDDDDALLALLGELDCPATLAELRLKRDERFADLSNKLDEARINKAGLF